MYKKILYALDIDSKLHFEKAIAISEQLNAELFVGYTTSMGEDYLDDEIYFGKSLGDQVVDDQKQKLETQIDELIEGTCVEKDHVYVVDGPVGKAIDSLATSLNIDLVIIAKPHHYFSLFIKPDTLIRLATHYDLLSFS